MYGAKHRHVLTPLFVTQTPRPLQVVAALQDEMSQYVPENPVAHVQVPSPVAGLLVVVQIPPFLQMFATEQNATLVVHVGPL